STTAKGSPYGDPPKSGWRLVDPAFIEASQAALLAFTGMAEMSAFQMLSLGKTAQLVPGIGAADASGRPSAGGGAGASRVRATATVASARTSDRLTEVRFTAPRRYGPPGPRSRRPFGVGRRRPG